MVFIEAFNAIIANKEYFKAKWREGLKNENLLKKYKSSQFSKMTENARAIDKFDADLFF